MSQYVCDGDFEQRITGCRLCMPNLLVQPGKRTDNYEHSHYKNGGVTTSLC